MFNPIPYLEVSHNSQDFIIAIILKRYHTRDRLDEIKEYFKNMGLVILVDNTIIKERKYVKYSDFTITDELHIKIDEVIKKDIGSVKKLNP